MAADLTPFRACRSPDHGPVNKRQRRGFRIVAASRRIYGRLRIHLEQGLDFAAAYERTLATTGAGVVLIGLTLAAGVATWVVAPVKFQADMGTVLTSMFLVNMVGAVVLLPALGAWLVGSRKTAAPLR